MATTTKSKSTKKPATAAKTTKKTTKVTPKKVVAAKTTTVSNKVAITPLDRIKSVNVSLAAAFLVFAALAAFFIETVAQAITLNVQTRDIFSTTADKVVLGPANEVLFNIQPKYLLVASLLISVVGALLLATKLRSRYELTLANRTSGFRWAITGISSAFLLSYVYLLAGITDLATLKMGGAMILATALFAFLADRENVATVKTKWLAFTASCFTGAMAWYPVVAVFIGTALYGNERFGWHVYAIAAVTLVGFSGFALRQYQQLRAGAQKDYLASEAGYLNTDLLTKFAVVLISLIALK